MEQIIIHTTHTNTTHSNKETTGINNNIHNCNQPNKLSNSKTKTKHKTTTKVSQYFFKRLLDLNPNADMHTHSHTLSREIERQTDIYTIYENIYKNRQYVGTSEWTS